MNKKIALVTNVLEYVGPPAVKALIEDGYNVVAQDPAFKDTNKKEDYKANHPGTVPLDVQEAKKLIQHVWGRIQGV